MRRGDRAQARRDLDLALELARQTGLGFIAAALEGALARAADSAEERVAHLAEGEALLLQTGIAHNYLWFYRSDGGLPRGPRLAACAALCGPAGVPGRAPFWVALMVERARAIIAVAQSATTRRRWPAGGACGGRGAGNGWALAGIDHALAN